ncbi:dipeptide epimerase [Caldalkalibacillus thermarum TA2.A1]|uniref:Dipeptide epimerase n=1 Tax=Caldalkalibacillus thermarum (strain TA2.A1) TaxID=986075 RepID=A0A8X8IC09_CALTT|nr:dipeptide epimerase [Caldalkalibacillus thermarum TA2.A1]
MLGGDQRDGQDKIETDYTISVNAPEEMSKDACQYVHNGFRILKVKVGRDDIDRDILRIRAIRDAVGPDVKIRIDANQGWKVKEAIRAIKKMEDMGLDIELVEQPVKAHDIDGLKKITDAVYTPIMADESIFSPEDAFEVLKRRAVDLINIKLMKCGGIFKAELINRMAEACGVECMVGSMIESFISVTAAAHFAASKRNITRFDFDAPLMLTSKNIEGGISYEGNKVRLPNRPGMGIISVKEWGDVYEAQT